MFFKMVDWRQKTKKSDLKLFAPAATKTLFALFYMSSSNGTQKIHVH